MHRMKQILLRTFIVLLCLYALPDFAVRNDLLNGSNANPLRLLVNNLVYNPFNYLTPANAFAGQLAQKYSDGAGQGYLGYMPYPSSDSVMLNPFEPSDESGLLLHLLQPFYKKATGRTFTVQDVPGRGGAEAWSVLAQSTANGYTAGVIETEGMVLRALSLYPAFSLSELTSLCLIAEIPLMLWVKDDSPYRTLPELVASAAQYPERLYIAGTGTNSSTHLSSLKFNRLAGIKTLYLPRMGTASSMDTVRNGQAHAAWGYAMVQPGMRPLATAAQARHPLWPDVPTFDEYKIAFFASAKFGIAVPSATPTSVIQGAAAVFYNIAKDPQFGAEISRYGFLPLSEGLIDSIKYVNGTLETLRLDMDEYGLE